MKNENGFVLPAAVIFSFIIVAFFIHQANLLLLEKKFYAESEEITALDVLMNNTIHDFQKEIDAASSQTSNTFIFQYEEGIGEVSYSIDSVPTILHVAVTCTTVKKRKYEVKFQYNSANGQILNWKEER